jgi:hypothetical protein
MESKAKAYTFESYKKFGIPPSIIHHIAVNNFVVHPNYVDCFSKYFLLYWEGQYIVRECKDGQIRKDGVDYLVIYHNCTRGMILNDPYSQYACSFREPQPEFGLCAYVLISK